MEEGFSIVCTHCGQKNVFVPRDRSYSEAAASDRNEVSKAQSHENPQRKARVSPPATGAIDSLRGIPGTEGILDSVRQDVQEIWVKLYPLRFIREEIAKASLWLKNNPSRQKKLLGKFLSNWLDRANLNRPFGAYRADESQDAFVLKGEVVDS